MDGEKPNPEKTQPQATPLVTPSGEPFVFGQGAPEAAGPFAPAGTAMTGNSATANWK